MKITVKIDTVEVCIEREKFGEAKLISQDKEIMDTVIIPTLVEATKSAKELFTLKHQTNETTQ